MATAPADVAAALVRAARDVLGNAREPLDRDAVSLLRVAEAARTVTAQVGNAGAAQDAATAHSHGTFSAIAELARPGSKP